ncbi:GNAT family N-acetyltransferase [Frigoribacterium sp. 2-23]|uniref:GNAT family N-acetyltransferase n=1 Tax=Frigoribacterium sp. 2-23 TaxID=3415006 RepID=UPI003C6F98FF
MRLPYELGDDYSLALRDDSTVKAMHELTVRELTRLRAWEPWAAADQTLESAQSYAAFTTASYEQGASLPTAIMHGREAVGSASLRLDRYAGIGELGFWIAAAHEGHGVVTRACEALIEEARSKGLARVEIRTAVMNARSRAVAERLGFLHEGTLRSALPLSPERADVALYGLVLAAKDNAHHS